MLYAAGGGAPRCCVKEKAERSGAAATLCHVDLYVVGSRQIFTVKILDVVVL